MVMAIAPNHTVVPVRHMMADRAARGGAQDRMMAGEMARDAADYRPFDAPPCLRGVTCN